MRTPRFASFLTLVLIVLLLPGSLPARPMPGLEELIEGQGLNPHVQKKVFSFPEAHGAHGNVANTLEWWYYNGNFRVSTGDRYGFELCFFRTVGNLGVCHVGLTNETTKQFDHVRYAAPWGLGSRWGFNKSGVDLRIDRRKRPFSKRPLLENWAQSADDAQIARPHHMRIHGELELQGGALAAFEFDLDCRPENVLAINGDGKIDMPEGGTSWYYSLTRMDVASPRFVLMVDGEEQELAVEEAEVWYDHQWGSFVCAAIGWDWFSFRMDDDSEYNLFAMRRFVAKPGHRYGVPSGRTYVSYLAPDGKAAYLKERHEADGVKNVQVEPLRFVRLARGWFAAEWKISIPDWDETFLVTATVDGQELPAPKVGFLKSPLPDYWEGSCRVLRTRGATGEVTKGSCYCEHMPFPDAWKKSYEAGLADSADEDEGR